jgi:hypothetical protein
MKWLELTNEQPSASNKTGRWDVVNKTDGSFLGRISWHGAWRQYCFNTTGQPSIWNSECMIELSQLLKDLNVQHKKVGFRPAGSK